MTLNFKIINAYLFVLDMFAEYSYDKDIPFKTFITWHKPLSYMECVLKVTYNDEL